VAEVILHQTFTKPYADYDEAGLAINLGTSTPDNAVTTILDNAEIPYEVEGNPDRYEV